MDKHYWVILMDNEKYLELVGTEEYVDNWMKKRYPGVSYRKVIWDN